MNRTTLLALAERVEAATRGSDELDAHIRCALFGKPNNFVKQSHINGAWCVWRIDGAGREVAWDGNGLTQLQRLGAFTASLDAAMSLVPSGLILRNYQSSRFVPHSCEVALSWAHGGWLGNSDHSFALALTAACLRARAIAGSMTDD